MNLFSPKIDILPVNQQKIWPKLAPTAELGFVLYGGTAIALQLGHRVSVDFDFFSHDTLDKEALFQHLPFLQKSDVFQDQPNALSLSYNDVKLSFFGGITFGRIEDPIVSDDTHVLVAHLDDLMATKLKVILQRVSVKDYSDIAAMLETGVSLDKGLAVAKELYGKTFSPIESLRAMTYFEGGDLNELKKDDVTTIINAASNLSASPVNVCLKEGLVDEIALDDLIRFGPSM